MTTTTTMTSVSQEKGLILVRDDQSCFPEEASSTPPRLPLHGKSTALILVHVQQEKWSGCPSTRTDFPAFPETVQATLAHCRRQDAQIIWVVQPAKQTLGGLGSPFQGLKQVSRRSSLPTDSWKPEAFASPQPGDVVVSKSGWSGTTQTSLLPFLTKTQMDTVLVCGLGTSVGVQHTAYGVFEAGFRTLVVHDACADTERRRHETALALYGNYMYEAVSSHDLEPNNSNGLWSCTSSGTALHEASIAKAMHDDYERIGYNCTATSSFTNSDSSTASTSDSSTNVAFGDREEEEEDNSDYDIEVIMENSASRKYNPLIHC